MIMQQIDGNQVQIKFEKSNLIALVKGDSVVDVLLSIGDTTGFTFITDLRSDEISINSADEFTEEETEEIIFDYVTNNIGDIYGLYTYVKPITEE